MIQDIAFFAFGGFWKFVGVVILLGTAMVCCSMVLSITVKMVLGVSEIFMKYIAVLLRGWPNEKKQDKDE